MTGKLCVLGALFMVGLVILWLCHVCCRTIWRAILMRLESSSRFSRILELSEINRERLGILPMANGHIAPPVTHLAFLTTYVSAEPSGGRFTGTTTTTTGTTSTTNGSSRYNRYDRLRQSRSNHHNHHNNHSNNNGAISNGGPPNHNNNNNNNNHNNNSHNNNSHHNSGSSSHIITNGGIVSNGVLPVAANGVCMLTGSGTNEFTWDRNPSIRPPLIRQDTQSTSGYAPPPSYLSIDSVGSEPTFDNRQSTTLTIASANSPPPSYHSTESIVSQPSSLHSHHHRDHRDRTLIREFAIRDFRDYPPPRQTSDSSEASIQSAPSHLITTSGATVGTTTASTAAAAAAAVASTVASATTTTTRGRLQKIAEHRSASSPTPPPVPTEPPPPSPPPSPPPPTTSSGGVSGNFSEPIVARSELIQSELNNGLSTGSAETRGSDELPPPPSYEELFGNTRSQ